MTEGPIIPEFRMYENRLTPIEQQEIQQRFSVETKAGKDRFRVFTDVLTEYVGSGECTNRSSGLIAMCAKASFLRGKYGFNQVLAKESSNLTAKGYAAAAYCRQSLDPRWLNNLRNYANQLWQEKDYIAYAELSGELASVLVDLGYYKRAREVASESIDKVTKATSTDANVREGVQAALLRSRIILAALLAQSKSREEGLIRLDSALSTAKHLNHQLALTDIRYYRAHALWISNEYDRALSLVNSALRKYDSMGYIQGLANARNLKGVLLLDKGQLQDARDNFEELLVLQQRLNDQIGLAKTLINVGEIDRSLGQIDQMQTYNQRALEISEEAEYLIGIATATINLGDVALRKGNTENALKRYEEGIQIADKSQMRKIMRLGLFLAADAHFMAQDFDKAIDLYREAAEVSAETDHPLFVFNAKVSEIMTEWERDAPADEGLLRETHEVLGSAKSWLHSDNASLMRDVRRKIYQDSSIESDTCVFFDAEKNFQCRVERTSLGKECFGNLFWMRQLCPYFKTFITHLEEFL
ncbi:MAG: tetratricopeptide repeat protein [Candidatus Thorarchaeota archaeon]|nr:tetratricopeptide repeat protein [Candidatus Thorarchaeota archaeon]